LQEIESEIEHEADRLARTRGGSKLDWSQRLRHAIAGQGDERLVQRSRQSALVFGPVTERLAAILVLAWWTAQVLSGGAISMHLARRRHPEWEWYLSHPVTQPPVFVAEALRPLVSNPNAIASLLSLMVLAGTYNHSFLAGLAALPVAIPFVVSAAVVARAAEVAVLLRSAPRNRGAWMTVMGVAGMIVWLLPVAGVTMPSLVWWLVERLRDLALMPSAAALLDLHDAIGIARAVAVSLILNAVVFAVAAWTMAMASRRGLESTEGESAAPAAAGLGAYLADPLARVRSPLLRKELIWLSRDRGMLLQLVFVPLLLCGVYALQFGSVLRSVEFDWARWCAVVAIFGTSLVTSAAPRMLAGEGPALQWMLSWPRSLIDTVRTKAVLLTAFAGAAVCTAALGVMWLWPERIPSIALVTLATLAWVAIVAFKSITLVPGFSSSGEAMPPPQGRAMAVSLGNFSFALGLFMNNWALVGAALVMNATFALALWASLRDHVDYLFDPDSEPPPVPPTPISALIAVVAYLELMAVVTTLVTYQVGAPSPLGWLIASVLAGGLVTFYVWRWTRRYGVGFLDIVITSRLRWSTSGWVALSVAAGAGLGTVATLYVHWLQGWVTPEWHEQMAVGQQPAASGGVRVALMLTVLVAAPLIEEYLFRGLLFRALARDRPLRLAMLSSAAFFAVIHPLPAWPPVFLVGVCAALVFSRVGNLLPAIALHATYNAVVVLLPLLSDG
jgi:membrane protease YdiL (CAAX protease family)